MSNYKKVRKCVIPVGGYGTRMLPWTKSLPKEMVPIVDTPALELIVREVVESGITDILLITNKNKKVIEDHFDRSYELENHLKSKGKTAYLKQIKEISELANIHYVRQPEANGLGGAILCAESFVGDEPFAVVLGDDLVCTDDYVECDPAIKQLIKFYERTGDSIVGVQDVPAEDRSKYGIVAYDQNEARDGVYYGGAYKLSYIIEKPSPEEAPSNLACLGRYVFTPDIFKALKAIEKGKGGEYQLTDAIQLLIQSRLSTVRMCNFTGRRYDLGSLYGYLEAVVEYALRRNDSKEFREFLENKARSKYVPDEARICKESSDK